MSLFVCTCRIMRRAITRAAEAVRWLRQPATISGDTTCKRCEVLNLGLRTNRFGIGKCLKWSTGGGTLPQIEGVRRQSLPTDRLRLWRDFGTRSDSAQPSDADAADWFMRGSLLLAAHRGGVPTGSGQTDAPPSFGCRDVVDATALTNTLRALLRSLHQAVDSSAIFRDSDRVGLGNSDAMHRRVPPLFRQSLMFDRRYRLRARGVNHDLQE